MRPKKSQKFEKFQVLVTKVRTVISGEDCGLSII